jgi:hypothetical protein
MKILIELAAYFDIFYPNLSFGMEKTDFKKFLDRSLKHWMEMLI